MNNSIEKKPKKTADSSNCKDHLANERTYLAWIRTNLGIMAFGFVVEKFSFFLQEFAAFLGRSELPKSTLQGYSSTFGITLVAIGAILCIFAFLKFKRTENQINENTYRSTSLLYSVLGLLVFLVGVFLIVYLIKSHTDFLQTR